MKLDSHTIDAISSEDKHIIDLASISALWLAFFDKLPEIALLVTIAWTLLRIWETDTVQSIFGRKKDGEETKSE